VESTQPRCDPSRNHHDHGPHGSLDRGLSRGATGTRSAGRHRVDPSHARLRSRKQGVPATSGRRRLPGGGAEPVLARGSPSPPTASNDCLLSGEQYGSCRGNCRVSIQGLASVLLSETGRVVAPSRHAHGSGHRPTDRPTRPRGRASLPQTNASDPHSNSQCRRSALPTMMQASVSVSSLTLTSARFGHPIPAADCSQQVCRLQGSRSDIADRSCDDYRRKQAVITPRPARRDANVGSGQIGTSAAPPLSPRRLPKLGAHNPISR
jgi:hypothetical protein